MLLATIKFKIFEFFAKQKVYIILQVLYYFKVNIVKKIKTRKNPNKNLRVLYINGEFSRC